MAPRNPSFAPVHPASRWTPAVKVRFLEALASRGNVRLASRQVGLSAETAYRQRRRDRAFARAWAAALALARSSGEQVLADRAIDGVEVEVWYRGQVVGRRIRYDSRLLLAHLARLDRLIARNPAAEADADRFEELLAAFAASANAGPNPALPAAGEAGPATFCPGDRQPCQHPPAADDVDPTRDLEPEPCSAC